MSLLLSLVFRSVCRTTHHRIVVDALRHLREADAESWTDLLLVHHGELLAGSMAPDDRFCDFASHVVHIKESYWGDAPRECRRWYDRTVDALRRRQWGEAAFAIGSMSHYFSDPFMPLHTAASEEDTKVHRPLEWCIGKCYGRLQHITDVEHGGYPQLETPRGDDWLQRMVLTGAELAHPHYDTVLEHFDLLQALRDPGMGMDQECQLRIATCLAHAVVGLARVLERAITEASIEPPTIETTLQGFVAALAAPLRRAQHGFADLNERMALEAFQEEAARTGKVISNLTKSQREVRRAHAEEVLRLPLDQLNQRSAGLTGTLYGTGPRFKHYPNSLICESVGTSFQDVSDAWRQAQRRVSERRQGTHRRTA